MNPDFFNNIHEIIFTTNAENEEIALNEIKKLSPSAKLIKRFKKGICLVNIDESFTQFYDKLNGKNLIFIRHIFPVHSITNHHNSTDVIENFVVNEFLDSEMSDVSDKSKSFSVQCRVFSDESDLTPAKISKNISDLIISQGYTLNVSEPYQIISVLLDNSDFYIGYSLSKHNISDWNGGNIKFAKDENVISRAEFKLLEAIVSFDLKKYLKNTAVDLGASPGGFTKILCDYCDKVYAVDPAVLDERVLKNKKVIHKKMTSQQFFRENNEQFNCITNDMKMDMYDSIDIIIDSHEYLEKDGIIIMTLKLPKNNQMKKVNKGLEILNKKYTILYARQLFHNRSEITVVLTK